MKTKFDDILRRRFEQQTFPVDPDHRRQMEALLGNDTRRRLPLFWWLGGIVLVIAVAFLAWSALHPTSDDVNAEAAPPVMSAASGESPAQQTFESEANHTTEGLSGTASSTPQAASISETEASEKLPAASAPTSTSIRTTTSASTSAETKSKSTSSTPASTATSFSPSPLPVMGSADESIVSSHDVAIQSDSKVKISSADLPASGLSSASTPSSQESQSNQMLEMEEGNIPSASAAESIVSTSSLSYQNRSGHITENIDVLTAGLIVYSSGENISGIEPSRKVKSYFFPFVETGAGHILANQPIHGAGYKWNAGAGVGYAAGQQLTVQLSGGYLYQSRGFSFQRESVVTQHGFGSRSQFNTLSPDRLHHVYGKAGIDISLRRHVLHGAAGVQYLYGAQGKINVSRHDQFEASSTSESQYAWLSLNGLRRWQFFTSLGYGYRLTPKLILQAGAQWYHTDLTKEDAALRAEGYYWNGHTTRIQPFISFQYRLHDTH